MKFQELAEVHAACFTHSPRPWTGAELESLLNSANTTLFEHGQGFAISRIAGPEAELLTIAVHPTARRQGIGKALVLELHSAVKSAGAEEVFLEVSQENHAAQALYETVGYLVQATRKGYYAGPNGQKTDALVMRCLL